MKLCADCGTRPAIARSPRCRPCLTAYRLAYKRRRGAETKRCAEAVAAWKAQHGNWCPGWNRPGHPATDLTAQHEIPFVLTGGGGPLTVLCRSCNTREGNARKRSDPMPTTRAW